MKKSDPARLFNSSLDGNVRRAIDIHEGDEVDESAFRRSFAKRSPSTVLASRNARSMGKPAAHPKGAAGKGGLSTTAKSKARLVGAKPTLLKGGNPQIAKADGHAPCRPTSRPWKRGG